MTTLENKFKNKYKKEYDKTFSREFRQTVKQIDGVRKILSTVKEKVADKIALQRNGKW